jgi:hypothetical protein
MIFNARIAVSLSETHLLVFVSFVDTHNSHHRDDGRGTCFQVSLLTDPIPNLPKHTPLPNHTDARPHTSQAISLLSPHPDAHDAIVAWRDANALLHREIDAPHPLFRVMSLTVAEVSRVLPTECKLGSLQVKGMHAGRHPVACTSVGAHHVAAADHVTHVVIGGQIHPAELARQRQRRASLSSPVSSSADPPTAAGAAVERARRQGGLASTACQDLSMNGDTSLWKLFTTPYVPIPLCMDDGAFLPDTSVPLDSMLTPNANLNSIAWSLSTILSLFSGYAG